MKSLSVLAGFILVLSVVITANNITWGFIRKFDRLLATDKVFEPSSWWYFGQKNVVVVYPPKGHTNYVILSAVRAIDYGGSKNFGYASLGKGGPGYRNATINLKSQPHKPLNFTIQYFGP